MNTRTLARHLAVASAVSLVAGLLVGTPAQAATKVEDIATGLNSPRQLAFSPGGTLYVAEAGARGDSTNCADHPSLGTFCLERNGSLARVGSHGNVKRVVRRAAVDQQRRRDPRALRHRLHRPPQVRDDDRTRQRPGVPQRIRARRAAARHDRHR